MCVRGGVCMCVCVCVCVWGGGDRGALTSFLARILAINSCAAPNYKYIFVPNSGPLPHM